MIRATTQTGLDRLISGEYRHYQDGRVALLINPTSVTSQLEFALDAILRLTPLNLSALFGPEHGIRGAAQDQVAVEYCRDEASGLPIHSLYGPTKASLIPTEDMLRDVDILIFDLQDVGTRIYTFIYSMALAMEACARGGKKFVVLDRPNPINGLLVEGNLLSAGFESFVGLYPLPMRHGMTVGELARYFNKTFRLKCDLEVVAMLGWQRHQWFDTTGLPWVLPSPNMPTLDTATIYPGAVLIEGTNLSEGRGTTRPFEIIGAPFIKNPFRLSDRLEQACFPGVIFRPLFFQPTFNKWQGQLCGGVQIHITDREKLRSYDMFLRIIAIIRELYPSEFQFLTSTYEFETERPAIDLLIGSDQFRRTLEAGQHSLSALSEQCRQDEEKFRKDREWALLYE
jgi:uncharacterized protein YbbC (DUF1343 family)